MRPSRSSAGGAASSAARRRRRGDGRLDVPLLAHAASVAGLALPVRPPYPRDVNAEPWPPTSRSDRFDFIDRRVMAAVERVAASDPNPSDPFRGLYISDETALRLTQGDSGSSADERLADGDAARSGSTCSTPRCWPCARRRS